MLLACGHAQVDARGLYVLMTHEVCQQGDVVVFCQEILREAVPEGVGIDHLGVNAVFYSIVPQALVYASLGDQPSPTVQKDEPRFHLLGFKPFQGCRMTTSYYHFDMPSLLKLFRYDKLNRIKRMSTTNHSAGVSGWGTVSAQYATNYSYDWNGNLLSLRRNNENGQVMHNIQYHYPAENNRLGAITATGLNPGTYQYDALGNLVRDNAEGLTVEWNALGKVDTIRRNGVLLSTFRYSPTGQRQVKTDSSGTTFYIHDATGNVMCIYQLKGDTLTASERYIYGSKRLGMLGQQVWITANGVSGMHDNSTIGIRTYELTDHLGNVTFTFLDRKTLVQNPGCPLVYVPFTVSYTDYYPFGYPIPERSFYIGGYRYFFNGQEADNEVLGEGVCLSAEFWQYDSRLGRRWNVDPVFKEYESPYACFAGNPVLLVDLKGKDGRVTYTETENGGNIVVETTFFVFGEGAETAVNNAKEQFSKLNTSSTVSINGKTYNVQLKVTWVVRQELANMDIESMDYDDFLSIDGYQKGDNFLRVGVPEGGGKPGYLGESQRGGNVGYSLVTSAAAVIHESFHNLGFKDTYYQKGFERDVMSRGPLAGQEINQIHYSAIVSLVIQRYNHIKERVIENQTQGTKWPVHQMGQDLTNPKLFHIPLKNIYLEY